MSGQRSFAIATVRLYVCNSITSKKFKRIVVGTILYGGFTIPFNIMWVPTAGPIALRPTVVIPLFFGFLFGPLIGFTTGFFGNLISDFFSFGSFFWNWDIGIGLIGLVAGVGYLLVNRWGCARNSQLLLSIILSLVGSLVGVGFAAVTDYLFGLGMSPTIAVSEFTSAVLTYSINGVILTPILLALRLLLYSKRDN